MHPLPRRAREAIGRFMRVDKVLAEPDRASAPPTRRAPRDRSPGSSPRRPMPPPRSRRARRSRADTATNSVATARLGAGAPAMTIRRSARIAAARDPCAEGRPGRRHRAYRLELDVRSARCRTTGNHGQCQRPACETCRCIRDRSPACSKIPSHACLYPVNDGAIRSHEAPPLPPRRWSGAPVARQRPRPRTPGSSQPRWWASSWRTVRSTCARRSSGSWPKSRSSVSW